MYFDSSSGLVTLAVRENELRVEYLGGSVRQTMTINFILAAFCGGLGGGLGGALAVVFVASTVLEVVRSFSSAYCPNTWQMVPGLFLLFVIRFLPKGIGSLWMRGNTR